MSKYFTTDHTVKDFIDAASNYGCIATRSPQVQIHHIYGRKARQNKLRIGEIAILPLWWMIHDRGSEHPLNVTNKKNAFENEYGSQKLLFKKLCNEIHIHPKPEYMNAIMER